MYAYRAYRSICVPYAKSAAATHAYRVPQTLHRAQRTSTATCKYRDIRQPHRTRTASYAYLIVRIPYPAYAYRRQRTCTANRTQCAGTVGNVPEHTRTVRNVCGPQCTRAMGPVRNARVPQRTRAVRNVRNALIYHRSVRTSTHRGRVRTNFAFSVR